MKQNSLVTGTLVHSQAVSHCSNYVLLRFVVTGGAPVPIICGHNTGQHMYIGEQGARMHYIPSDQMLAPATRQSRSPSSQRATMSGPSRWRWSVVPLVNSLLLPGDPCWVRSCQPCSWGLPSVSHQCQRHNQVELWFSLTYPAVLKMRQSYILCRFIYYTVNKRGKGAKLIEYLKRHQLVSKVLPPVPDIPQCDPNI